MDYTYNRTASKPYAPAKDRKGRELHPGDRVRFKRYPRGTGEGVVIVSERTLEVMPDGSMMPSLGIETDDGTRYALYEKGVLKLR